jgi:small redox-active disulfide protein 2
MKIQVLGTGCARCDALYENAQTAVSRVEELEGAVEVEKVTDPEVFFRHKVYVTPALVIDGRVISTGKPIPPEQIEAEIRRIRSGE